MEPEIIRIVMQEQWREIRARTLDVINDVGTMHAMLKRNVYVCM